MPRASVDVAIPTDAWMHGISTALPEVTFRVVSAFVRDGAGIGVLEVAAADPLAVLGRLDDVPEITRLELLWSDERAALVQFETADPALLQVAHGAGVPVRTPFEV